MNKLLMFLLNMKINSLFKKSKKLVGSMDFESEGQRKEYNKIHRKINLYFSVVLELEKEEADRRKGK